jgi:signal transduction histidine kinase
VTEPFARGDAARSMTDEASGFGLGLATSRVAAEIHGGRLTLHDVNAQSPQRGPALGCTCPTRCLTSERHGGMLDHEPFHGVPARVDP